MNENIEHEEFTVEDYRDDIKRTIDHLDDESVKYVHRIIKIRFGIDRC